MTEQGKLPYFRGRMGQQQRARAARAHLAAPLKKGFDLRSERLATPVAQDRATLGGTPFIDEELEGPRGCDPNPRSQYSPKQNWVLVV